jgi:hypothetical protein
MRLLFISIAISFFLSGQTQETFINYATCRVNNTVPNQLTKQDLLRLMGKPTKITGFNGECGLTDEQENAKERNIYYYDSTQYFVYDNKAELYNINFRNGKFTYRTDKILLSNKTKFGDLAKWFPANTHASLLENQGQMVRIPACKDCDLFCLLYFEKDRLVSLEWWEQC